MKQLKNIQKSGIVFFALGLLFFSVASFFGPFTLEKSKYPELFTEQEQTNIGEEVESLLIGKDFSNSISFSNALIEIYNTKNEELKANQEWDKVMWTPASDFALRVAKESNGSVFTKNPWLVFLLSFGVAIVGALMYILPTVITLGEKGIKNDKLFQSAATNRGWLAYITFAYLVGFYVVLYFYPYLIVNQIAIVSPLSEMLSGNPSSQWFLYGFIYCVVMIVMGIKVYIKYRHNAYQIVRTSSVLFFQIAFAFIIPELLVKFNMPYMDFKNAWPLDYDFFFDWNINNLVNSGNIGIFMLVWGIALTLIVVPVLVYFYGKRWYCSWVCGCGGLAETLGDPYRHLSDKSTKAWKIERYLIHGVLVFAVVMTSGALYTYFTGSDQILGLKTYDLQKSYGFLIGSIFSGVIGTGFYPVMGNRVWCRFGCPLAAYMGIVQRFKSRFRITTNGGQCISCGNCSTYCEQGIDVRAYAQKGQNIVRASCVGCGVCSAVCPRGVLKLENGPEKDRIKDNPILIGADGVRIDKNIA